MAHMAHARIIPEFCIHEIYAYVDFEYPRHHVCSNFLLMKSHTKTHCVLVTRLKISLFNWSLV